MEKNKLLPCISERRSIRKYSPEPVEKAKLELCMEAARLAPSACNIQPYRFIILSGKIKDSFCEKVFTGAYSACSFVKKAPVIAAIISTKTSLKGFLGNQVQGTDFKLVDIGIAGEHFALQACELGLGTCWIGWFSKKTAGKHLKLKTGESVEILFSIGYPAEKPEQRKRKDLKDFVHYEE